MKKKNLILLALIGSVGAGVYYMGKNKVLNGLKQNGFVQEVLTDTGKVVNVLTDKGNNQVVQKAEVVEQPKMFDYNNPATHSTSSFWISNTVGTFYLPNLKDGKETGEYTELILGNDGTVEPTKWESIKEGLKSVVPFWK